MAPAKRSAPKASPERSGVKTRKMAKTEAAAAAAEAAAQVESRSHFEVACANVLALLEEDPNVPEAARSMLTVAAPFALKEPSSSRHKFQHELVSTLAGMAEGVQRAKQNRVQELEAKAAESDATAARLKEELEAAKAAATSLVERRDASKAAMESAGSEVSAAKAALEGEKAKLKTLSDANVACGAARTERHDLVEETWTQLKNGMTGAQWRARNKLIDRVGAVLEEMGLEESVKLAVPVALKTKALDRGEFAWKALEFAEEALRNSVAEMDVKLKGHEAEVAEQRKMIDAAEERLAGVQTALGHRESEYVASENALLQGGEAVETAGEKVANFAEDTKALTADLAAARTACEGVMEVMKRFESMVRDGAVGAEPPAAQPAPAESTEAGAAAEAAPEGTPKKDPAAAAATEEAHVSPSR
eukprot:TRINITY_DN7395_c0_g5_i1.p1 TRINITY_DN7395_c0_g5~~TRINITY_DN7395_c0_g5_i1.p1  ORF type:complete len:420 (-),score=151.99 TRINITY_DN7395_c0_g5_i1:158-1417(-)